jgi:hypothetical protein
MGELDVRGEGGLSGHASLQGSAWSPGATEVLTRAVEHFGGIATWRALRCIRLFPARLSGLVPWLKGVGKTFSLPSAIEIFPHERRARFLKYPDEDHSGTFENGVVRLARNDGSVVVQKTNHRASFRGFSANRRWAPIDALYFFGYALTHYHSLPFSLFDSRLLRFSAARSRSEQDVLAVELPADLPTHSRRQSFYFDHRGQLTRHDYHAEIVGPWARGAHFWNRQTRVNGFPISLERHVVARLGAVTLPFVALHATFANAEVEFER